MIKGDQVVDMRGRLSFFFLLINKFINSNVYNKLN